LEPAALRDRVLSALQDLKKDPRPNGVKKLKGAEDEYRIRVQDYRILYTIDDARTCITVLRIENRREVYR